MGMEEQHEATRLYATMLQAHREHFGEPDGDQKRYLWGLAQKIIEAESLELRWGMKADKGVLPRREFKSRMLAEDAVEHSPESTYLVSRWESPWTSET